jgi:hypothetical protein
MTKSPLFAVILLLLAAVPSRVQAQREGPSVEYGVMIGASRYDLSGTATGTSVGTGFTGTGFSFKAGITIPLVRRMVFLEPSIGFLSSTTQFGHHTAWMFPELTVQAQQRIGLVRPYLGVGLGTGTTGLSGPAHWKFTMLGLGGVRVQLGGRWGVRGEVRLRSVDPWNGHTTDFGVGFTRSSF